MNFSSSVQAYLHFDYLCAFQTMKYIEVQGKGVVYYIFPQLRNTIVDEDRLSGKTFIGFRFPDGKRFFIRHQKINLVLKDIRTLMMFQEGLVKSTDEHIAGTVDIVRNEDHFFAVRSFVDGVSLKSILRTHSMKSRSKVIFVMKFFRSMLEGLSVLHDQQIVMCNLRPANVYVKYSGGRIPFREPFCVISDFSMAKTPHFEPPEGFRMPVTYLYNAPEVLLSAHSLIGPASDLYSVGAMLYEALKGHHPFRVPSPKVAGDFHLSTNVNDFRGIHPSLEIIIKKAMSKRVFEKPPHLFGSDEIKKNLSEGMSKRYQTCEEMIRDIDVALETLTVRYRNKLSPRDVKKNEMPAERPVVIFDDMCMLCTSALRYMIKHDKYAVLRYSGLSKSPSVVSEISGREILKGESILLIDGSKVYERSDAFIRIMQHLGGVHILFGIMRIIPRFIRDFIYILIARRRYAWWGMRDECYIPPLFEKHLFVESGQLQDDC
jgi:predicted DCC family thiol-disulfide oxidoreductase YuxK